MRLTMHNGRRNRGKAFSRIHNDRNFDTSKAKHIDRERSKDNQYWHCYIDSQPEMTFEEAERKYYEDNFRDSLDNQNAKYEKNRHLERCITMDQFMVGRGCPEEFILQVGKKGETVPPQELWQMALDYMHWLHKKFSNVQVLDMALHTDEQGAAHVQGRLTWFGKDKDGFLTVGQNKALKEMGIERPDLKKKESKVNNAKMTYTAICRNHLLEMCKKRGYDIEIIPKEASRSGLSLIEYQARQEREKAAVASQRATAAKKDAEAAKKRVLEARSKEKAIGNEKEWYQALEESAYNLPVKDGVLGMGNKIRGYEHDPKWTQQIMRLARFGTDVAAERLRADEAESRAKWAEREKVDAVTAVHRAQADAEKKLASMQAKIYSEREQNAVWFDAPEDMRTKLETIAKKRNRFSNVVNRGVADFLRRGVGIEATRRYFAGMLSKLGMKDSQEQKQYIMAVEAASRRQAQGDSPNLQSDTPWIQPPSTTNYSKPLSQKETDALLSLIHESDSVKTAGQVARQDDDVSWEGLTEQAKKEQLADSRFREDW